MSIDEFIDKYIINGHLKYMINNAYFLLSIKHPFTRQNEIDCYHDGFFMSIK